MHYTSGLVDATDDDDSNTRKAKLYSDSGSRGGRREGRGERIHRTGNLE
jgi:hypothetical protein